MFNYLFPEIQLGRENSRRPEPNSKIPGDGSEPQGSWPVLFPSKLNSDIINDHFFAKVLAQGPGWQKYKNKELFLFCLT